METITARTAGVRALAPLMPCGASIVNVSSVAGLGGYHAVGYTISRWGVRALSRVASLELGPRGIRSNAILPGYIETPMTASAPESFRRANGGQSAHGGAKSLSDAVLREAGAVQTREETSDANG